MFGLSTLWKAVKRVTDQMNRGADLLEKSFDDMEARMRIDVDNVIDAEPQVIEDKTYKGNGHTKRVGVK